MQLGRPRRLAHAEIDAAARQQVERRDALGDAMRLVGGELDHAVAEPDALGALAGGAEEHLGRGGVRVLLEEVVLDLPGVVVAELVGELDLGRASPAAAGTRSWRPTGAGAGARRRCRTSWFTCLCRRRPPDRRFAARAAAGNRGPSRRWSRSPRPAPAWRHRGRSRPAAADPPRRAGRGSAP